MFCFATVLTAFYGRRGAWLFAAAALVGISRITTGSHWPSDIVLTAMLSVGITVGLLALYRKIWARLGPRIVPRLARIHPDLLGAQK
jgi:membrane-associated phospholipid phosphatase